MVTQDAVNAQGAAVTTLRPRSVAEVGAMLRDADERRLAVLIRGNGTKAGWGAPPRRTDVVLSLAGLHEPIEHCAGDLTVTAPAGATLDAVNALLAREGQWLPLDPWAGGASTIGGLLATNDSGPRRLRAGAPRDLVIGIEYALTDGRLVKAGGRVVKNVAGYDMGRLLCGSFGSLAAITSATFKLSPVPPASRTVVIEVPSETACTALVRALAVAPVTPSAVELQAPGVRLLVRFETTPGAADQQAAQIVDLAAASGASATIVDAAAETAIWSAHAAAVGPGASTLVRVSTLPTQLGALLGVVDGESGGLTWRLAGRALQGVLLLALDGAPDRVARLVSALREHAGRSQGHVAVLMATPAVRALTPAWDDVGSAAGVMQAVKAQFDPHGTLCPGGGPGGLA
ncbi:MAG: FAD-binding oxidoreductase [Vicinamibacterales bacterium]